MIHPGPPLRGRQEQGGLPASEAGGLPRVEATDRALHVHNRELSVYF
jgi:hypothetical protein